MCTATWIHGVEELELFFNRDESRRRGPETPPARCERGGVRYLAPGDTEGGGTWIAVAESGLCLALLNAYGTGRGTPPERPTSRGHLIPSLIDHDLPEQVSQKLLQRDLSHFRPFVLLALAPGRIAQGQCRLHWDGLELSIDRQPTMPLCSSGVEQELASRYRHELLARMQSEGGELSASLLESFHSSHEGGPNALTPCMHRPEAETRSLCRVRVDRETVSMQHVPDAPCRTRVTTVQIHSLSRNPARDPNSIQSSLGDAGCGE